MRVSDLPAVTTLCGELGYPAAPDVVARRFEALNRRPGEQMLVATEGEAVHGWVHVRRVDSLESDVQAEVWGLVVDARVRSKGVGRALLESAERWAVDHGLPRMRIRSNVVRDRAHAFYARAGYIIVKRQSVFEKRLT